MKIKKIVICSMLLIPFNVQASFFPSMFSKPWNTISSWFFKAPISSIDTPNNFIDTLINQEIKQYERTQKDIESIAARYLSSQADEEKAFYRYKNEEAKQVFIEKLVATTIELQSNPAYQNNPKGIVREAKLLAGKEHCNTYESLDAIWIFLPKAKTKKTDFKTTKKQYKSSTKILATKLLFDQVKISTKDTLPKKIDDARKKLIVKDQQRVAAQKKHQPTSTHHIIGYIHYPATCITPIGQEKSLPFSCIPNQRYKDQQKITFDTSKPHYAKEIETSPYGPATSNIPKNKKSLPFKINVSPDASHFNIGYQVIKNRKYNDSMINSHALTGKSNRLGGSDFAYGENGNFIGKFGYRDKNGNMRELD